MNGVKFIVARGMALLVNLRGLHLNFLIGAFQRFHMASFSPVSALFLFWVMKSIINYPTLYGEFSRCSRPLELKTFVHVSVLSLFRVSLHQLEHICLTKVLGVTSFAASYSVLIRSY